MAGLPAITGLTEIIKKLLSMVSLKDWSVSHNGTRIGPITDAHCGIKGQGIFWARFTFNGEDGASHGIVGERALAGSGSSTVTLDGLSMETAHIALKKHLMGFPVPHLSVEIDFDTQSPAGLYRFDAKLG